MEFQAIILAAGIGTRFRDLVGSRPKCLLQVGPYPLIFYPLNFASKFGFTDVIVIVLESQRNEIAQRVAKLPLNIKCEFISLNEEETGTADALRAVNEKITRDVLILSCDTVTNIDFYPVLNMFRMNDASIVSVFAPGDGLASSATTISVPGPKSKHKQERDLVGIDSESNRLVFLASSTDYHETVHLPGNLLRSHGKVNFFSSLADSHIYLVKRWVIDFLAKSEKFSTLKGELLPFIVKKQLSRPFTNGKAAIFSEINFDTNNIFEHIDNSELNQKMMETNLNNSNRFKRSDDIIRCYAYVSPSNFFCIRVNTLLNYCLINNQIVTLFPTLCDSKNRDAALVSKLASVKSTQFTDSAVGDNTNIFEKTSIKSSVCGSNCIIKNKTRIANSFIMSNVTIEERVVIENSIICDRATIKEGSVLKNCIIGHNFVVAENTTKEKAHLTGEEVFMEI